MLPAWRPALITLAGALLGYPVLLWLDPLAIFSGFFGLWGPSSGMVRWVCACGLPAVLVLSVFLPGAWCARLCPLGGVQDLLALPRRWLRRDGQGSLSNGEAPEAGRPTRRVVLASGVGIAWAALARRVRATSPPPLRPPGAMEEARFVGLCVRCGNCVRACPARILRPDAGEHGIAGLLAPVVRFRDDYCLEDCRRCIEVCPSGAIARLTLEEKRRWPIGLPRVDMSICLLADEQECAACRNRCPYEAVMYIFSEAEYTLTPRIDPAKCPGCGACQVACPTTPVKAIVVYPC